MRAPLTNDRVYRGFYAPNRGADDAASEGEPNRAQPKATDSELHLPPHASATLALDLPFALPAGHYSLHVSYEYFQSTTVVPPEWFTGTADAPPIDLSIGEGQH